MNPKEQLLSNKSNQELMNEINANEQEIARRKIESSREGTLIIKIEDFMHPEVKPLASGLNLSIEKVSHTKDDGIAIYSVFNFDTGIEVIQRAGMIINLFGKDGAMKLKFMNKRLGDVLSVSHFGETFRIKFLHLEKQIPKSELNTWAKKLGRKPEEILLGTPKEYYHPKPTFKDDDDEVKKLLQRKLELELREKEIELAERESKLKKGT